MIYCQRRNNIYYFVVEAIMMMHTLFFVEGNEVAIEANKCIVFFDARWFFRLALSTRVAKLLDRYIKLYHWVRFIHGVVHLIGSLGAKIVICQIEWLVLVHDLYVILVFDTVSQNLSAFVCASTFILELTILEIWIAMLLVHAI